MIALGSCAAAVPATKKKQSQTTECRFILLTANGRDYQKYMKFSVSVQANSTRIQPPIQTSPESI
jgi:hypothetical protein